MEIESFSLMNIYTTKNISELDFRMPEFPQEKNWCDNPLFSLTLFYSSPNWVTNFIIHA